MIAARSYVYKGKRYELDDKLSAVLSGLAGLEHLVVMGRAAVSPAGNRANCLTWDQVCDVGGAALTFERLPFSHPLYVLFTSGTTGLPKCIVHTTGGVLLEHRKEHVLHCDVRPGDVMSWYTNTAWMMYTGLSPGSQVMRPSCSTTAHPSLNGKTALITASSGVSRRMRG
jgi:acetoacetyl-CoA synthetase